MGVEWGKAEESERAWEAITFSEGVLTMTAKPCYKVSMNGRILVAYKAFIDCLASKVMKWFHEKLFRSRINVFMFYNFFDYSKERWHWNFSKTKSLCLGKINCSKEYYTN